MIINEKVPYFGDDAMACSESTLRLLIERGVVDLPMSAVKMMTGLHGNINGSGNRYANCGAINGACAAIGSVYGKTEPGHDSSTVYRLVEEFLTAFEEKFGSIKCLGLADGRPLESLEQQYNCAEYVLFAAETVERLLKEEKERNK
ncbi:MAG: C-GCAxxG-C-C family protein [Oscillospiraceae bacterium]|nr:C-GCAxxG-C-C family protein [Oscillospiraceae bacterium]